MGQIFGYDIPLVPQALLDRIIKFVTDLFAPIIKPITGAANLFFNFREITVGTIELLHQITNDATSAYSELHEFSVNFDRDARHRVVETVRAYQQIRRMAIDIPVEIWNKVKDFAQDRYSVLPIGLSASRRSRR